MTASMTLPPLDPATLTELHQRYEDTPNVESRTRYQMILLAQQTGIQVTEETGRVYLHAQGYECLRPTWTLRRKAGEQADYVGKECG